MDEKIFYWQIIIHYPGQILFAGLILCFLGMIITTAIMISISKFFYYRTHLDASVKNNVAISEGNQHFSIMALELPGKKFWNIVEGMDQKTKQAVIWQLKVDYFFMPFAYVSLLIAGCFVHLKQGNTNAWFSETYLLAWLPLVAWLFDIIENKLIRLAITSLNKNVKMLILLFSATKWLIVAGCLAVFLLYYFIWP